MSSYQLVQDFLHQQYEPDFQDADFLKCDLRTIYHQQQNLLPKVRSIVGNECII